MVALLFLISSVSLYITFVMLMIHDMYSISAKDDPN